VRTILEYFSDRFTMMSRISSNASMGIGSGCEAIGGMGGAAMGGVWDAAADADLVTILDIDAGLAGFGGIGGGC
jgi:hypothetical protein